MTSIKQKCHLLRALRRIFRSLTRILLHVGIRFDEFEIISREVFVESAIRDYAHHNKPSRARIAAFTGLTGRQINQHIEGSGTATMNMPMHTSLLIEVLQKWHTVAKYGGPYGIPLELEFDTPSDRCIRSLVALVDPKASPEMVLDELLRSGSILRASERRFRPASRFLMSTDPASPRLIERFGMKVSQLAATLEYNMDPAHTQKRLDREVLADRGLPLELVPAFESYVRSKTSSFLMELDNWLASQRDLNADAAANCHDRQIDTGVNVFLYIEPPWIQSKKS
jgi:hypothetical protein